MTDIVKEYTIDRADCDHYHRGEREIPMAARSASRFRQINLLYAALVAALAVVSLISRLVSYYRLRSVVTWLTDDTIFYALFVPPFLALAFARETNRTRLLQILTAMGLGVVAVAFIAPRELGGDLNFIVAAILAYKYGFLRTAPIVRLFAMVGVMIAARITGVMLDPNIGFVPVLNQIVITLASAPMLYWLFERDLLRVSREKQHLERVQEDNQPFVEFGRNVTGIVHDFKNDLGLFDSFAQYLSISEGDPIDSSQIRTYRSYVRRLSDRINRIMVVTQGARRFEEETGSLQDLIRSTLYVFESNLRFKRTIRFDVQLPEEPLLVRLAPAPMISILENLVRNSCEALTGGHTGSIGATEFRGTLSVRLEEEPAGLVVIISDDAGGMPFCGRCGQENCLNCAAFQAGITTKADGSGVGIPTVRRQSLAYGIPVTLINRPDVGVTARIVIERSRLVDTRQVVPVDTPVDVDG
jgi:signal transduction histidine kinase